MTATPLSDENLLDKINKASLKGQRYTPTLEEWRNASPWLRRQMTWPREIISEIRSEGRCPPPLSDPVRYDGTPIEHCTWPYCRTTGLVCNSVCARVPNVKEAARQLEALRAAEKGKDDE